jgi:flagellar protein FlgJ
MDSRLGGDYGGIVDSGAYTDLNRLASMKGKDQSSDANIKKVAQEFESLFLSQMMKSMRSANEVLADKDSPFSSDTTKQYQDMHDQQLAVNLSRNNGGIGLAAVLERQLSKTSSNTGRKNPFAQSGGMAAESSGTSAHPGISLWPSSRKTASVEAARDDSKLLNQRRLALPSKLPDRLSAGFSGDEGASVSSTIAEQLGYDWQPAQTSSASVSKAASKHAPAEITPNAGTKSTTGSVPAADSKRTTFSSKEDFINTLMPMAEAAAKRIGVDSRYLVAQAALETGWGKHMIRQSDGSNANNLFGIKSHGWKGGSVSSVTNEYVGDKEVKEVAKFRTYDSYADSFHDYVNFLQSNERYGDALKTKGNSEKFMSELQEAGYATDPRYARKVNQIARQIQKTYQTIASVDTSTKRA